MIKLVIRNCFQGKVWHIRVYYADGSIQDYESTDSEELDRLADDMIATMPNDLIFIPRYSPYDDGDNCAYHYVNPSFYNEID